MGENKRYPLLQVLTAVAFISASVSACGVEPRAPAERGPYVLRLAPPGGEHERPAAWFPHEEHVKELGEGSCVQCHERPGEGAWLPRIKGMQAPIDADQAKEAYHGFCISCHEDRKAKGAKTGPDTACGVCHRGVPGHEHAFGDFSSPAFDLSLHQRHASALGEDSCGICHHSKLEGKNEVGYVKGQESACSACHRGETKGRHLGSGDAGHGLCVKCHVARKSQGGSAGPTECAVCHDAESFGKVHRLASPARLQAGQKDQVLLEYKGSSLPPVRFDHKAHEARAGFCTKCHREEQKGCRKCHPMEGDDKGAGLLPEQVFHDPNSDRSCVGCHMEKASSDPSCAGCHELVGARRSEHSCAYCHGRDESGELAEAPRTPGFEVPKEVRLDSLSRVYEAAYFPHAKVLEKLEEAALHGDAAAFHGKSMLHCTACHHKSPLGEKPPKCGSCHSVEADPSSDKPGLAAAYHRQCLGCHQAMGLTTKCEDCHKQKTISAGR